MIPRVAAETALVIRAVVEIIGTLETLLVLKLEISSRVLSSCVSHDKGITLMESLKRLQEGLAGLVWGLFILIC